jgi:RHS repeat-associated protein
MTSNGINTANLITNSLKPDAFGNNIVSTFSTTGAMPAGLNPFNLGPLFSSNQLPTNTASVSSGTINAGYDYYGELTTAATGVSSNQYLDMAWDPLGRLAAVTQTVTGSTERYQYAPSGMRVATMDGLSALQNRYYAYNSAGQLLTEWNLPNSAGSTSQVVAAKAQTASSAVTAVKIAAASPKPQSLPKPDPNPEPIYHTAPQITSFTVGKALIPYGGTAVLSWSVTLQNSLTVNGVSVPAASTSLTVTPNASTTTYTLVAANSWGTATATVTVQMQPGIISFNASPATIVAGTTATLNWTTACASSVTLNGAAVSGSSLTVTPSLGTNTYTLTATTPGIGSISAAVTITVDADPTVPTITFSANPTTMLTGQSTTLTWSVSNSIGALAVTLNGAPVATSGSTSVALTSTTGFLLSASSTVLSTTVNSAASVQVTVDPYPTKPSIAFTVSPSTVTPGGTAVLSWVVTSAVGSVAATLNGWGVPLVGSQVVNPSVTTSYPLVAVSTDLGATASNSSNVTVTVTPKPIILSFSACQTTVPYGGSTTLSWQVSGASTTQVNGVTQNGTTMQVSPAAGSTTYTLTITNAVGSASASVVVTSSAWIGDVIYLGQRAVAEITDYGVFELHSDHLGTPRIITSGASGVAVGSQTYAPYGELIQSSGYVPLTGFTGHLQTEPNGLIYMRGRFYSPAWHCFLNSDQGADPGSLNQYAYCHGNPMTLVDPSGLNAWDGVTRWFKKLFGDEDPGSSSSGSSDGITTNSDGSFSFSMNGYNVAVNANGNAIAIPYPTAVVEITAAAQTSSGGGWFAFGVQGELGIDAPLLAGQAQIGLGRLNGKWVGSGSYGGTNLLKWLDDPDTNTVTAVDAGGGLSYNWTNASNPSALDALGPQNNIVVGPFEYSWSVAPDGTYLRTFAIGKGIGGGTSTYSTFTNIWGF